MWNISIHLYQINKLEETIQDLNDRLGILFDIFPSNHPLLTVLLFVAESDVRQERVLKDKNSIIQMKVAD